MKFEHFNFGYVNKALGSGPFICPHLLFIFIKHNYVLWPIEIFTQEVEFYTKLEMPLNDYSI